MWILLSMLLTGDQLFLTSATPSDVIQIIHPPIHLAAPPSDQTSLATNGVLTVIDPPSDLGRAGHQRQFDNFDIQVGATFNFDRGPGARQMNVAVGKPINVVKKSDEGVIVGTSIRGPQTLAHDDVPGTKVVDPVLPKVEDNSEEFLPFFPTVKTEKPTQTQQVHLSSMDQIELNRDRLTNNKHNEEPELITGAAPPRDDILLLGQSSISTLNSQLSPQAGLQNVPVKKVEFPAQKPTISIPALAPKPGSLPVIQLPPLQPLSDTRPLPTKSKVDTLSRKEGLEEELTRVLPKLPRTPMYNNPAKVKHQLVFVPVPVHHHNQAPIAQFSVPKKIPLPTGGTTVLGASATDRVDDDRTESNEETEPLMKQTFTSAKETIISAKDAISGAVNRRASWVMGKLFKPRDAQRRDGDDQEPPDVPHLKLPITGSNQHPFDSTRIVLMDRNNPIPSAVTSPQATPQPLQVGADRLFTQPPFQRTQQQTQQYVVVPPPANPELIPTDTPNIIPLSHHINDGNSHAKDTMPVNIKLDEITEFSGMKNMSENSDDQIRAATVSHSLDHLRVENNDLAELRIEGNFKPSVEYKKLQRPSTTTHSSLTEELIDSKIRMFPFTFEDVSLPSAAKPKSKNEVVNQGDFVVAAAASNKNTVGTSDRKIIKVFGSFNGFQDAQTDVIPAGGESRTTGRSPTGQNLHRIDQDDAKHITYPEQTGIDAPNIHEIPSPNLALELSEYQIDPHQPRPNFQPQRQILSQPQRYQPSYEAIAESLRQRENIDYQVDVQLHVPVLKEQDENTQLAEPGHFSSPTFQELLKIPNQDSSPPSTSIETKDQGQFVRFQKGSLLSPQYGSAPSRSTETEEQGQFVKFHTGHLLDPFLKPASKVSAEKQDTEQYMEILARYAQQPINSPTIQNSLLGKHVQLGTSVSAERQDNHHFRFPSSNAPQRGVSSPPILQEETRPGLQQIERPFTEHEPHSQSGLPTDKIPEDQQQKGDDPAVFTVAQRRDYQSAEQQEADFEFSSQVENQRFDNAHHIRNFQIDQHRQQGSASLTVEGLSLPSANYREAGVIYASPSPHSRSQEGIRRQSNERDGIEASTQEMHFRHHFTGSEEADSHEDVDYVIDRMQKQDYNSGEGLHYYSDPAAGHPAGGRGQSLLSQQQFIDLPMSLFEKEQYNQGEVKKNKETQADLVAPTTETEAQRVTARGLVEMMPIATHSGSVIPEPKVNLDPAVYDTYDDGSEKTHRSGAPVDISDYIDSEEDYQDYTGLSEDELLVRFLHEEKERKRKKAYYHLHEKPLKYSPKGAMYSIIQGHSKVHVFGSNALYDKKGKHKEAADQHMFHTILKHQQILKHQPFTQDHQENKEYTESSEEVGSEEQRTAQTQLRPVYYAIRNQAKDPSQEKPQERVALSQPFQYLEHLQNIGNGTRVAINRKL